MGAHAICIYFKLPNALKVSYPFMIATPLLAAAVCGRRARISEPRMRFAWLMIAGSMMLWSAGMFTSALEYFAAHAVGNLAGLSDLLFLLYGVPILLVISSSMEGERSPLFLWLDAMQAICAGCLIYVLMFGRLPFEHQHPEPISMPLVVATYNVVNVFLAAAATLRLFAHSSRREEGRMYRILTSYLWFYAVVAAINNYLVARLGDQTGFVDLLADPSFLLVCLCVVLLPVSQARRSFGRMPAARYIDNASPIVYTTVLLALSAISMRRHFYLGMLGIALALAVYAIRSTILQNRYMRSEQSLREAHDRLEELSLQDGLTGVANRRCFDAFAEREWSRAVRMQHPISLLLIDLDHFKNINDKYGHRMGDHCLVQVAGALREALPRDGDLLARYGGEEFAAVLVDADREGAETVANRMRQAVRGLRVENEIDARDFMTVSIGISTYRFPEGGSLEELVEASDRALYRAKESGRDRVEYLPMLGAEAELAERKVATA